MPKITQGLGQTMLLEIKFIFKTFQPFVQTVSYVSQPKNQQIRWDLKVYPLVVKITKGGTADFQWDTHIFITFRSGVHYTLVAKRLGS